MEVCVQRTWSENTICQVDVLHNVGCHVSMQHMASVKMLMACYGAVVIKWTEFYQIHL